MASIGLWVLGSLIFGFGYTLGAVLARASSDDEATRQLAAARDVADRPRYRRPA